MDCEECGRVAAELALDIVCGRERAHTLAHLEHCEPCQDLVAGLTSTVHRLVEQLVPEVSPPEGFRDRVLVAVRQPEPSEPEPAGPEAAEPEPAQTPAAKRSRVPVAAALITGATLLIGGGLVWGPADRSQPQPGAQALSSAPTVVEAPLLSDDRTIGRAYVHTDDPSWVFVSITDPRASTTTVSCMLLRRDGPEVSLGSFAVRGGRADWGARADVDSRTLAGAELTNARGRVVASADFTPPQRRRAPAPHQVPSDRGGSDHGESDQQRDNDQEKGRTDDPDHDQRDDHRDDPEREDPEREDPERKDPERKHDHGGDHPQVHHEQDRPKQDHPKQDRAADGHGEYDQSSHGR